MHLLSLRENPIGLSAWFGAATRSHTFYAFDDLAIGCGHLVLCWAEMSHSEVTALQSTSERPFQNPRIAYGLNIRSARKHAGSRVHRERQ